MRSNFFSDFRIVSCISDGVLAMEEKVINSQNSIRVKNKSNLPIRRTASVSELKSETYIKTSELLGNLLPSSSQELEIIMM